MTIFTVNHHRCLMCCPLTWTRVLERLSPRAISSHLRTFADYLICEFSSSNGNQQINKCIESLNDLVWKCWIVPIDRLILCLVRSFTLPRQWGIYWFFLPCSDNEIFAWWDNLPCLDNEVFPKSFSVCWVPPPLPPLGHIWDVMLVWRKGNIEKTVSVLQYCVVL